MSLRNCLMYKVIRRYPKLTLLWVHPCDFNPLAVSVEDYYIQRGENVEVVPVSVSIPRVLFPQTQCALIVVTMPTVILQANTHAAHAPG